MRTIDLLALAPAKLQQPMLLHKFKAAKAAIKMLVEKWTQITALRSALLSSTSPLVSRVRAHGSNNAQKKHFIADMIGAHFVQL